MENMVTHDARTPLQKLRRSQLWRIAVARGYCPADNATKEQILPLVHDATHGEIVKAFQDEVAGLGLPAVKRVVPVVETTAEPLPPLPPQDILAKETELFDLPGFKWSARAVRAGLVAGKGHNQVIRNEKSVRIVAEYELRNADIEREDAAPETAE